MNCGCSVETYWERKSEGKESGKERGVKERREGRSEREGRRTGGEGRERGEGKGEGSETGEGNEGGKGRGRRALHNTLQKPSSVTSNFSFSSSRSITPPENESSFGSLGAHSKKKSLLLRVVQTSHLEDL